MAHAREIELLILASHGIGGVTEFRLASTAQKVVYAADTSVLVVPARETTTEETPFETVLVPVDCTAHADWAVTLAARLARAESAELVALHVVEEPVLLEPHGTERERELIEEIVTLNRGAASRYMESLARRLEAPDLRLRTQVVVADKLASALGRHASAEPRPLLVLSTRGSSRFDDGPYGGLIGVMLANTGHPVLILRATNRGSRGTRRWSSPAMSSAPRRVPLSAE
jgi:nucleotide-binding universal stress UspA family protein